MIFQIDDWEFDIDMARTMEYSAAEAAEHCRCAYCRNFYECVDLDCPELRPFLAQFGLDVEAPDELMPYDVYDRLNYSGKYVVFGRITRLGSERIYCGGASFWPMADSEFDFEAPHFILSLEELELLWRLDEPLKDVISPANEPSFLKKMWDRLLSRRKNEKLNHKNLPIREVFLYKKLMYFQSKYDIMKIEGV